MANLLIVDDNPEATRPLAMLLRFFKHQVDVVGSGDEAMAYLSDKLPDAIVLDVMMPGMDGMEVLRRVRADQRTRGIGVVMFSAVSDPAYRAAAMSKGADDYVVKGNEFEDLRARVERAAALGHNPIPAKGDSKSTERPQPSYH
jgi:two-component system, OmpR family, phosphate regulon response regulator PhoB